MCPNVDDHGLEVLKKAAQDIGDTPKTDYALQAVVVGESPDGTFKQVKTNTDGFLALDIQKTHFDEVKVSERSVIFELKSVYGLSNLHNVISKTGGGNVVNSGGENEVSVGASGTDYASLQSAERGRYLAGQDAQIGVGIRIPAAPTGNQDMKWGAFDSDNGFGFGYDSTGLYCFVRKSTTDTKVYSNNWNYDPADGAGPSGLTLNVADGNIYQIDFAWYGYGTIDFKVNLFNPITKKQVLVLLHRTKIQGENSVSDPNLPITAQFYNNGTAAEGSLFVGGRQYSTFGKYNPSRRINGDRRISRGSVGATFVPVISFRRKTAFKSTSVKTEGFDILTDQPLVVELRLNATLTGASFGNLTNTTASETALEVDTSATAVSGGELVWLGLIGASGQGLSRAGEGGQELLPLDFVNAQNMTLCVRAISGTATVSCAFRVREEW